MEHHKYFQSIILMILIASTFSTNLPKQYIASVVEFGSEPVVNLTDTQLVKRNIDLYLHFIEASKRYNTDVLVFPEATLNYLFPTRDRILAEAIEVPKINVRPCDNKDTFPDVLVQFCETINIAQTYTLINLVEKENCENNINGCPNDGYLLFNTNIVFDRNGTIISRYRKYNLYIEPLMNITEKPNIETFTTDFGVEFGHFVCFDILFETPALNLIDRGVKNFLYPSMWFSEIPFLTSVQIHSAWAYRHNVNLISAGASNPIFGSTGSGIFAGRYGALTEIISPDPIQKMLTTVVKIDDKGNPKPGRGQIFRQHYSDLDNILIREHDLEYTIGLTTEKRKICKKKFCCQFELKYNKLEIPQEKFGYIYRVTMLSETRSFGVTGIFGEVYCAVIACTNDQNEACGKRFKNTTNLVPSLEFEEITIQLIVNKADTHRTLILPTTLDFTLLPLNSSKFDYSENENREGDKVVYSITSKQPLRKIMSFGIFGRNFTQDVRDDEGNLFYQKLYNCAIRSHVLLFVLMIAIGWISFKCF